ncbi:hypothetical protein [Paenibacillus sp. V4I7]|uniref:hypothetical protein n=1 Tax=Paenibacillus sp. V4I7 TaxID=3042307 RepID=UPI00277F5282|nr:hypothetical protein [Paenibacillus sp. V4I7]MDQ0899421.1 hypothetical protein [Paenibacillus sp. V4I7]
MDKRKVSLFALTIIIVLLNVLASFRWNYNNFEGDMRYKTDRWTNKDWVEFYPPLAIGSAMEFPLLNSKFNSFPQLESHVEKIAMSGYLVSEWLKRMKLTYLYYGINSFLIIITLILLAMITRTRKSLTRKSALN